MSETDAITEDDHQPGLYEIRVKGHLEKHWAEWFEGMTMTLEERGETLLRGPLADQAALHGLLKRIRDLGVPLLSVIKVDPGKSKLPEADTDHTDTDHTDTDHTDTDYIRSTQEINR